MKPFSVILLAACIPLACGQNTRPPMTSLKPDFVLHVESQAGPPRTVLGPMKTDSQGKTTGSFSVYGGASLVQVSSLSFSADGRLLAVGSTPNRVDIWDIETRSNLGSLAAGSIVALSPDGRLIATNGRGIEVLEIPSGKQLRAIPWTGGTIWGMRFHPSGKQLLVRANGEIDTVFDVTTGQKIASLTNTQEAQFSSDGAIAVGGNAKHITVWNTKDWSLAVDLPNGPEYVTRFAVSPNKDLIIVGGPKSARLVRLSTGVEVAKVGTGYTNFAAFDGSGALAFTYTASGFGVWDTTGKSLCTLEDMGNGTMALSANEQWLAAGPVGNGRDVIVWSVENLLKSCH